MRPISSAARLAMAAALLLVGCSSTYYAAIERVGKHKREILVDRVRDGQQDQREAEEQFLSTYDLFKQASGFQGGELEDFYERMNREFEKSEAKAEQVRERIDSIENVARALFKEWESELGQISNAQLRAQSQRRLDQTRDRYGELIGAMRRADERMEPVLTAFRDQVLFLKHNLNAAAIASLQDTALSIQSDVDALIREMRESIREAESFLAAMDA